MDLNELVAIDVHTHAEVSSKGHASLDDDLHEASSAYFKVEGKRKPTLEETAAYYRERKMAAVIFTVDAESATGTAPVPNEEVAEAAAAHPDVLIPSPPSTPSAAGRASSRPAGSSRSTGSRASSSTPASRASSPTTGRWRTSCTR